jgi:hypothetical protein
MRRAHCSPECDTDATQNGKAEFKQYAVKACKSLYPGSIPGEASKISTDIEI